MPSLSLEAFEVIHRARRATIYRVRRDGSSVVLKVLNSEDPTFAELEQLAHEHAVGVLLQSDKILRAVELTRHEGRPAIVLEDFGGIDLYRQRELARDPRRFLGFALKATEALSVLHGQGFIHRDLKPHNILYNPLTDTLKLSDLGLAVRIVHQQQVIPQPGGMEGTPAYVSPEQTGKVGGGVDFRSDLYSLGATFYHLATGQLPFEAGDLLEWAYSHVARTPTPAHRVCPEVPLQISKIIDRLLAKSPDERYQTAAGLQWDLEKCLTEYGRTGMTFPLGERDQSHQFQVRRKLYGREKETRLLLDAFARAKDEGRPEVVLVSGYSGVGKSALVQELNRPIIGNHGLFLSGKFDQFKRHIPRATIAQALADLVRQLLSLGEEQLASWKKELQYTLGASAAVLLDVVPELHHILGEHPPAPELGPIESQNRFNLVFQNLLKALATPEHPLALFLDDMQWADSATLSLLEATLGGAYDTHLLLLLAYRDNEVDSAHPLMTTITHLREQRVPVSAVHLSPLTPECVEALVSDTLLSDRAKTAPLAALVSAKTDGNPFFVGEFLKAIHRERQLRFDPEARTWVWNQSEIEAMNITDNVVDLMIQRLRTLPIEVANALQLAACIGNWFDLSTLATVSELAPSRIAESLEVAIEAGLISREPSTAVDSTPVFRFQHDRIQQAASRLIPEGAWPALHLRIGRLMWQTLSPEERQVHTFELANHLNLGADLITDAAERRNLLELNRRAGRKARASTAYGPARRYLMQAKALLPVDVWKTEHAMSFALNLELAECAYLGGALEEAEAHFRELLDRADGVLEAGAVFGLQMRLYQVAGNYAEATSVALRSFTRFGLDVPQTDAAAGAAVGEEAEEALRLRGAREIESLIHLPSMVDPKMATLLSLLEASGPPLYMVKPALFPWVALKMVNLSLQHGNTQASCYGYGIYAILLAAALGDVESGYAFSQLAIRLNQKLEDVKLKGSMLHLLGDHVNFWKNHIATDLPILEKGFHACVEGGDLIYSNYIGFQSPWHLFETGAPLEEIEQFTEKYAVFALQTKHKPVYLTIRLEQHFLATLRGSALDERFNPQKAFEDIVAADFACGIVYRHILEMVSSYFLGRFEAAWAHALNAEKSLPAAFSMPIEVSFYFFRALTAARLLEAKAALTGEEEGRLAQVLDDAETRMSNWAKSCPQNFSHKRALIAAERARLAQDTAVAMREYEHAMAWAREQGFIHYEALANERAGHFYSALGVDSVADGLLRRARMLFAKWGGRQGKTQHLESDFRDHSQPTVSLTSSTFSARDELDMISVVKSSQSISSEMQLPKLLETLMRIVLETAAADRGALVLLQDQVMTVAAKLDINQGITVEQAESAGGPPKSSDLPVSLVNFVRRSGEKVLIENASLPHAFSEDPYFQHQRPRSVLCLPLKHQSTLSGVFYLENSHIIGAFSADRLSVLELLGAQVAISIENSRLYKNAQDAVRLRDDFLSIASHELRTPLTPLKMHLYSLTQSLKDGRLAKMPPESLKKIVFSVDRQINRLRSLIEDLLDVTRITSGRLVLNRERVDLAKMLRDILDRNSEEALGAQCSLSISTDVALLGEWDLVRLEQVVMNLLNNAVKYSQGNPIEIDLSRSGDRAVLVVTDHGIGIAESDLERIFERFERVRSRQNVTGLGLGLFIVRQIVQAHGGTVCVRSELGKGSTFVVELPLLEQPTDKTGWNPEPLMAERNAGELGFEPR